MPRLGLGTIERDATRLGVLLKPPASSEGNWIDYSMSSAIAGWSTLTTRKIWYLRKKYITFVEFELGGVTSNTTYVYFNLPVTASNQSNLFYPQSIIKVMDSYDSWTIGMSILNPGSNTIYCYPTINASPWTTGTPGATRRVAGSIQFPTTD